MEAKPSRVGPVVIVAVVMVVLSIGAALLLPSRETTTTESASAQAVAVDLVDIDTVYDPVREGDPLPDGFRQLLGRDQIAPVYDPTFAAANQVDWPSDSLVIGVAGVDDTKAYPVTHLNQREMVIDHLDGEPILVSW